MFSGLRTVVMWLIAMAIPMQGLAIAVMPLCPPSHHSVGAGEAYGPAIDVAVVTALSATDDRPIQHGMDHAAGAGHHDDIEHEQSGHSGHDMLNCCSAGCSMAVLMAPSLAARAPLRSPVPLQAVAQFCRGVTLDGLDRPPKHILA